MNARVSASKSLPAGTSAAREIQGPVGVDLREAALRAHPRPLFVVATDGPAEEEAGEAE